MKIAIPTNDKIVVCNNPRETGFFEIVSFRGEELIDVEYRDNPLKGGKSGLPFTSFETDRLVGFLSDCDVIICGTSTNEIAKSHVGNFIKTVVTDEFLTIRAASGYNMKYLQHERNTCCSP
jgi:hypothetical protein